MDFLVSPIPESVSNYAETVIKIFSDSNFTIKNLSSYYLRLSDGVNLIDGSFQLTDGTLEYITNRDLAPNTKYTVMAVIELDGYQPTDSVLLRKAVFNKIWQFTTGHATNYKMTRRSEWVSAFRRDGSRLIQMGNDLYMYGGWTAEPLDSYSEIYRSNGDLSSWEKLPDAKWHGRHTFGTAKINNEVFVFGGDNIYRKFDVWKSSNGYDFQLVADNLDSTVGDRILYGSCAHNNQLFIFGGQSENDSTGPGLSDVWSSSSGDYWNKVADNKSFLAKNISGSVESFNGKIWVVGGGYYKHADSAVRYTNFVYSSFDGADWQQEPDAPWMGRQYADLCVWNNKLWMIGGDNFGNLRDIWYLDKQGNWIEFIPPPEYEARHATAVGVYNDQLVIACGNYWNDCWVIERE